MELLIGLSALAALNELKLSLPSETRAGGTGGSCDSLPTGLAIVAKQVAGRARW